MVRLFIILFLLFYKQAIGNEMLFEDFNNSPEEKWEFISDDVMGGFSNGKIEFIKEKNISFARMTGNVSL